MLISCHWYVWPVIARVAHHGATMITKLTISTLMLPIMIYIFKEILPQPIELTKPLNKMRDMISIPNKKLPPARSATHRKRKQTPTRAFDRETQSSVKMQLHRLARKMPLPSGERWTPSLRYRRQLDQLN